MCRGEAEIIGGDRSIYKKIKCTKCGYTNAGDLPKKSAEVVIIRRPNRPQ